MDERSTTVTRRVQPARGKSFCEAETLNANNEVKLEVRRRTYPCDSDPMAPRSYNRHKKSSTCQREELLRG